MNELFKKLFEANILNEETKAELETALEKQLSEAVESAKADAIASVTAELHESWAQERDALIEALDAKVSDLFEDEKQEWSESVAEFRDVEAEYAVKLVEARADMQTQLETGIQELVESLDAFLTTRLSEELAEFETDVQEIKKQEFGKSVFEAFVEEFKKHYAGDDSIEAKLNEAQQRLEDTQIALEEAEKKAASFERSIKMEKVLSPLSGRAKEVMEAILARYETSQLEEGYETFIGRVIKETSNKEGASEKETTVLAEGKKEVTSGVVKTGDNKEAIAEDKVIVESEDVKTGLSTDFRQRLKALGGIRRN